MNITPDAIHAAARHLRGSERGRQALADLFAFLDNGACGLDAENQRAILTLCGGAWTGYAGTVLDVLQPDARPVRTNDG